MKKVLIGFACFLLVAGAFAQTVTVSAFGTETVCEVDKLIQYHAVWRSGLMRQFPGAHSQNHAFHDIHLLQRAVQNGDQNLVQLSHGSRDTSNQLGKERFVNLAQILLLSELSENLPHVLGRHLPLV